MTDDERARLDAWIRKIQDTHDQMNKTLDRILKAK